MANPILQALTQTFATVPTANTQLALYTLTIRAPGGSAAPVMTYTFPLSPENLRKESYAMTGIYDVQGSPSQNGVQRIADKYGLAPPMFTIEGNTGWQRHSTDGFLFTGLQSVRYIEQLLQTYAQLTSDLVAGGASELYTLEFYDYFRDDYWQVEPIGPQGIRQNAAKPLLTYYSFQFAGIRNVAVPIFDEIAERLFTQTAAYAMRAVQGSLSRILNGY